MAEENERSLLWSGVVKTENPASAGIPLSALGMRPTVEQYRESRNAMEAKYGSCWEETFAEIRESSREIAKLERENAKLQAKVTRLESERNLLALETGQHWKN